MRQFSHEMRALHLDIPSLKRISEISTPAEAQRHVEQVKTAAAVLFTQWERIRSERDKDGEFAIARLFNMMTKAAQELDARFSLFDKTHLDDLAEVLAADSEEEQRTGRVDLDRIAEAMHAAAEQRTHEVAWPWVMLPTVPEQHYGRIFLQKVDTHDKRFPMFITQPTFLPGEITQFHTHGQNWAFGRPLGKAAAAQNEHINTLWHPTSQENVFPLKQVDRAVYSSQNVVIIPPRAIHGISGYRAQQIEWPAWEELRSQPELVLQLAEGLRFGERSCMHIYRPDWESVEAFADTPLVQQEEDFFELYDMLVFDHRAQNIWSGGGGAWRKRNIEFGFAGEHCQVCFTEDDPRRENIDPALVLQWYLLQDHPELITYTR